MRNVLDNKANEVCCHQLNSDKGINKADHLLQSKFSGRHIRRIGKWKDLLAKCETST